MTHLQWLEQASGALTGAPAGKPASFFSVDIPLCRSHFRADRNWPLRPVFKNSAMAMKDDLIYCAAFALLVQNYGFSSMSASSSPMIAPA